MKSRGWMLNRIDKISKHTYTNMVLLFEYEESTYHEGTIIMKYNLCEYKDRLSSLNMVRENHIPYMIGWVKYYRIPGDPDDAEFADVLFRDI